MHNTENVYQKSEEVCTRTHTLEESSFSSYQHVLIYPQQPSSSFSGQSSGSANFLLHQAVNLYVHLTVLQYGEPISILAAPLDQRHQRNNLLKYNRQGAIKYTKRTHILICKRQLRGLPTRVLVINSHHKVCDSITRESIWQVLENIGVP